jgi:hypothetical protein
VMLLMLMSGTPQRRSWPSHCSPSTGEGGKGDRGGG